MSLRLELGPLVVRRANSFPRSLANYLVSTVPSTRASTFSSASSAANTRSLLVLPYLTARIAPSASVARIAASVTVPQRRSVNDVARRFRSGHAVRRAACPWQGCSAARTGLGGTGPLARTARPFGPHAPATVRRWASTRPGRRRGRATLDVEVGAEAQVDGDPHRPRAPCAQWQPGSRQGWPPLRSCLRSRCSRSRRGRTRGWQHPGKCRLVRRWRNDSALRRAVLFGQHRPLLGIAVVVEDAEGQVDR